MEWLFFTLLIIAGFIPFFASGFFDSGRSRFRLIILISLLVMGGTGFSIRQLNQFRQEGEFRLKLPRQGRPDQYVSSNDCRSCHPDQYHSWHQSFHRTMTQYAAPSTVKADFNNVTMDWKGDAYRFFRKGDEFWVDVPDLDWKLRQSSEQQKHWDEIRGAPRLQQRVGLLTGSHHFQNFWIHAGYGNTQYILPFSWIIQDNRWVPISDIFLKPPDEPSVIQFWNNQCIVCHTSAPQPRKQQDSMVFDSRTAEIGISCESCHGPAEEHVARYRNPLTRYRNHFTDGSETGIRNPEKMDHRLSSQVCGQCHSARINFEPQFMTQGTTYRPGRDLHENFGILLPGRPDSLPGLRRNIEEDPEFYHGTFWPDGIIRVTGREFNSLLVTPCFERGEMSCLSCHSSHDSDPNDQLAEGMRTNQACLQCHDSFSDKLTQHTRHSAGSSGSLCYNCHMPHTTYGLLGAIRNHYIDSPNVKKTLETGRPNACNSCHLDKTLAWTNNQLKEWYGTAPADLNEFQKSTAASILNLLSGDANQRVLTAWAMGWKPAREVSGEDWIPHYLVKAMQDDYSTIRYIAHKSLINIPGYENTDFDYVATESARAAIIGRIPLSPTLLDSQRNPDQQRALLFDSVGRLMRDEVHNHINRRDTKPISLME